MSLRDSWRARSLFILPEIDERSAHFIEGALHVLTHLVKRMFDRPLHRVGIAIIIVVGFLSLLVSILIIGHRYLIAAGEEAFGPGDGPMICPDENPAGEFTIRSLQTDHPNRIAAFIDPQRVIGGGETDVRFLCGLLGERVRPARIEVEFAGVDRLA